MGEDDIRKLPRGDNKLNEVMSKLRSLKKSIEFEINTTYNELNLIKNSGFAVAILTILITYFAYPSIISIIGFATRAYLLFVFLLLLLLVLFRVIRERKANKQTTEAKIDKFNIKQYNYKHGIDMQVLLSLLSSFVIIYFGLFILHIYGLYYSSVVLKLSNVFNLYNPIVNSFYAISVITSIITLMIYFFKRDSKIAVPFGLIVDSGLILLTSISLIICSLLGNYPFWFSYQLWLALIIVGLAYFALAQYISAVPLRAKLTKYKNGLSITRARLDKIIMDKKDYDVKDLLDIYTKLKTEFSELEKPKLVYISWLPPFLDIYANLDMKEEAEIYFEKRGKNYA
jgi:hypothetical protein